MFKNRKQKTQTQVAIIKNQKKTTDATNAIHNYGLQTAVVLPEIPQTPTNKQRICHFSHSEPAPTQSYSRRNISALKKRTRD